MMHEANLATIRRVYEAFQTRDADLIRELFAPEIVISARRADRSHPRGKALANGASFDIPEVHVWELRDGKVVRYRVYIDTPAMLDALGR